MEETLQIGDFLIVSKFIFGAQSPQYIGIEPDNVTEAAFPTGFRIPKILQFKTPAIRAPQPNDIIIFEYPLDRSLDFVKRCIAVGGQTVEQHSGEVFVDGLQFPKPAGLKPPGSASAENSFRFQGDFGPQQVKEGYLFMMGDNRDNSRDSRDWGLLADSLVIGKPLFIYLSMTNVDSTSYPSIRWERLGKVVR